jgi:hypothetical protein
MAIKTFTTGEVLTAADTNTYLANSGLVYISSTTVGTAVASVTVSSAFSSTYDNYKITYSGGAGSGLLSLGISLGASITGYSSVVNYALFSATGTPVSTGDNNAAKWGFVGYASTNYSSMTFDLMGPFLAKYTTYGPAAWAAVTVSGTSSGIHTVATSYTGFTISPDAGTLTGGTITVYGYRKG